MCEEVGDTDFNVAKPEPGPRAGEILAYLPPLPVFVDERAIGAGAVRDVQAPIGQGNRFGVNA